MFVKPFLSSHHLATKIPLSKYNIQKSNSYQKQKHLNFGKRPTARQYKFSSAYLFYHIHKPQNTKCAKQWWNFNLGDLTPKP